MDRYTGFAPCRCCDGAGDWYDGPYAASSEGREPAYRQVACPECNGTGKVECEPRTLDDLDSEEMDADAAAWVASICALASGSVEPVTPVMAKVA